MKILYDHQVFRNQKFGGINRYYNEIMKINSSEYEALKIDPTLFPPDSTQIEHTIISRGARFLKRKLRLQEDINNPRLPAEVIKIFRKSDYDIFHPTYYNPYFLKLNHKPFVVTVYDMIHEIFKEHFSDQDSNTHNKWLLCQKASRIIAISEKTKEDLISIFGIPSEKVHTISLASNFNVIVPQKPENLNGITNYILFVGNRGFYKNFYFSIIALTEILKGDKSLKILCTGHTFSKYELQFFHDRGIKDQMIHVYLHNDNELAWVYKNAALFIFPSLYEGFGFPILEAFVCDCPVISSTGGSLPEVAGDAAVYFDPKNFVQIQQAAYSVLYDKQLRNNLILKGRERFKMFSWDKCRAETVQVYKKVLDSYN